jgi:uncharacterized membrane protein
VGALATWQQHARHLKREARVLWLAQRHPDTPWHARLVVLAIVAYVASPIDLIPAHVLDDCRARAASTGTAERPAGWLGSAIVVTIWLGAVAVLTGLLLYWRPFT